MKIIKNLKIEKLVYKGFGLGFSNSQPVFVTGALPGEVINAKIEYKKGKSNFASIHEILTKSPDRIEPQCEVFGICGGCDWLNLKYEMQLKYKQQIVDDIYHNYNIPTFPIISGDKPDYYRNKSYFPISLRNNQPSIGMFARRSHEVVPHKQCLLHPEFFDKLGRVFLSYAKAARISVYNEKNSKGSARHLGIRYSNQTNELIVVFVSKTRKVPFTNQLVRVLRENFPQITGVVLNINPHKTNVILGNDDKILFGRDHIFEKISNIKFKLHYKSFFQVNLSTTEKMYDFIKAQLCNSKCVVDAYCGVGSIALNAAGSCQKIFGIENNINAVKDAEINAELNGIENCKFIDGNVETELAKLTKSEKIDTIIFDPPRKGLDKTMIAELTDSIQKIIYVSCDPNTQKRDVELLINKGFKPVLMQPFDMFPHTFHIENVIVLEK